MSNIHEYKNRYKKYVLVTLADNRYTNQAKQLFSSAYFQGGWTYDFALLSQNVSPKNKEWFSNKGIYIYDCKPLARRNIGSYNLSFTALIKFYLFTPYFKKWEKVIFLDADIIVKASLEKLTKISQFAAVPDCIKITSPFLNYWCTNIGYQVFNRNKNSRLFNLLENKFDLTADSFNTGVMVIPTKSIQPNTLFELKRLFNKYKNIAATGDQTILNLFFYKKWKKLSYIYNSSVHSLPYYYRFEADKMKTAILHFLGNNVKPWNIKSKFYLEWTSNLKRAQNINVSSTEVLLNCRKISLVQEYIFGFYLGLRGTFLFILYLYFMTIMRQMKHFFLYNFLKMLTLIKIVNDQMSKKSTNKIIANVYISTSPNSIFRTIWTILSLNYYVSNLHFVVIPEQPLNSKDRWIFSKLKANLEIISNQRIEEYLKDISKYSVFHYFALGGQGGKKLLVSLLHPGAGKTIIIDQNIVFLKDPKHLKQWLINDKDHCIYLKGSENKLVVSRWEKEILIGRKTLVENFSSHLLCLSDKEYKNNSILVQLEKYFSDLVDILSQRQIINKYEDMDPLRYSKHIEPTIYSLIAENCKSTVFPDSYSDNNHIFIKAMLQGNNSHPTVLYIRNNHFVYKILFRALVNRITNKNINIAPWLI